MCDKQYARFVQLLASARTSYNDCNFWLLLKLGCETEQLQLPPVRPFVQDGRHDYGTQGPCHCLYQALCCLRNSTMSKLHR